MAAGLDVNESVVTSVNYQVQMTHTPGSYYFLDLRKPDIKWVDFGEGDEK